jgi:hypothetical protein
MALAPALTNPALDNPRRHTLVCDIIGSPFCAGQSLDG